VDLPALRPDAELAPSRLSADRQTLDRAAAALREAAPGAADGGAKANSDLARLKKVARQFESLLVNELLKNMRATVPENTLWGDSGGTRIYRQMHDEALAENIAASGNGLGIADLIVQQMRRTLPGARGAAEPSTHATERLPHPAGPPPPPASAPDRVLAPVLETASFPQRSVTAYRQQILAGDDLARMRRLQSLAAEEGGVVADSLATYGDSLAAAAAETGLDPGLILAVAIQESSGNPAAVSRRGARGLMQLMPGTAREVGVQNPHDPDESLRGGARYLARMLKQFAGRIDLALAAYNAGPGAVERAGDRVPKYPETQRYVEQVRALAQRLGVGTGTEIAKEPHVTSTLEEGR
jgi:soluble lytic murein transglycosylase-like protein